MMGVAAWQPVAIQRRNAGPPAVDVVLAGPRTGSASGTCVIPAADLAARLGGPSTSQASASLSRGLVPFSENASASVRWKPGYERWPILK
jgi:hypothetical protein